MYLGDFPIDNAGNFRFMVTKCDFRTTMQPGGLHMPDLEYPSYQYAQIGKFCTMGALAGALLGVLILFACNGSIWTILAGISAGAWFGFALGIVAAVFLRSFFSALFIGLLLGGFAGLIWWVVAGEPSSFSTSMILGACIGTAFILLLCPWRSKEEHPS
jgi:hypothetical protein